MAEDSRVPTRQETATEIQDHDVISDRDSEQPVFSWAWVWEMWVTCWCRLVETGIFDIHEVIIGLMRNSCRYASQMLVLEPFHNLATEQYIRLWESDIRFHGISKLRCKDEIGEIIYQISFISIHDSNITRTTHFVQMLDTNKKNRNPRRRLYPIPYALCQSQKQETPSNVDYRLREQKQSFSDISFTHRDTHHTWAWHLHFN